MNILINLKWDLERKIENIRYKCNVKKYKKLYSDYKDDEFNNGDMKFIWGITSWDDLSGKNASLYTMNDIDIIYDRKRKKYMLGIETAFIFRGNKKEGECKYLKQLLEVFGKFMDENNYSKDEAYMFFMSNLSTSATANTIEELYTNFRIFVEGFCKIYENEPLTING